MPQATKESFARALDALVRKYEADRDTYLSSQYNEAQTRSQFITPLLEALGWDVRNEAGVPYNLCEVLEEKGETHGRPDYTFRINGQTKFFLEAKKPSEQLQADGILQTKRYAWNAARRDVFFAGVCDFEQFRFFDASLVPSERSPLDGEAFHLIYKEYGSSIDTLWELSRERVAAGSLGQWLKTDRKSLRQRAPLDETFLESLTKWRHELASAIHSQNDELDAQQLNDIVQRLLDRIIFIRIAEDRKIIDQRQLREVAEYWEQSRGRRNIMDFLLDLFREINENFNGEIFKAHACEEVRVDSGVLARIIRELYPPKSNYMFNVVPVELLGSIYERYLGNTLTITGRGIRIEPKPEVRKAGGVYYTPQYVVDYVVKNTVGRLIEGKSLAQVQKMRFLDPACGSGSFLLGAFQCLIEHYIHYLEKHPKEARKDPLFPDISHDEKGQPHLSVVRKAEVLRNNLYGVDIDPQAVEVTMMSLYLKAIEGERSLLPPKHRLLPPLHGNIRCGNSLVGPDIEKGKPLTQEERQRIRPFDWNDQKAGFGDILESGGFDAVIGNPPWGADIDKLTGYIQTAYPESTRSYRDSFKLFIERGLALTKASGLQGFVVPSAFMFQPRYLDVRQLLMRFSITRLWNAGDRVFGSKVVAPACVFVVVKRRPSLGAEVLVLDTAGLSDNARVEAAKQGVHSSVAQSTYQKTTQESFLTYVRALRHSETTLDEVLDCKDCGIKHQRVGVGMEEKGKSDLAARLYYEGKRQRKGDHAFLTGSDLDGGGWYVDYSRPKYLRADWKDILRKNEIVYFNESVFSLPEKIVWRQTSDRIRAAIIGPYWFGNTLQAGIPKSKAYDLRYVLGLLNSKYLNFIYIQTVKEAGRVFPQVKMGKVRALPFRTINFADRADCAKHNKIVSVVQTMIDLSHKKHSDELSRSQLDRVKREIEVTGMEIDNLVYELYGITDEERKIVEAQP